MNHKEELPVAEFFHSIQGEGITTGVPAVFLRLMSCNLLCGGYGTQVNGSLYGGATWRCDTIEVWTKGKNYGFEDLTKAMDEQFGFSEKLERGDHLIITGGEPMLHQFAIVDYLTYLGKRLNLKSNLCTEIETNATILPCDELAEWITYWNCSPKLSNSGMPKHKRIVQYVLHYFNSLLTSKFKFVVRTEQDVEEIHKDFIPYISEDKIILMPGADTREELAEIQERIVQLCIKYGYRFGNRAHIQLWDKKTGV